MPMSKGLSRLSRCMRAPIRALSRARDLYIRGMTGCAGRMQQGLAASYPVMGGGMPRSFSYNSSASDDDLRELIRMASRRSGVEIGVPRSQSVVVGRIDEDAPCEFADEVRVGSDLLFPRSRSCAVVARGRARALDRMVA